MRKSASTAECVVLSLMGPASTVYHYQFKAVGGVVQIHPSRKSMVDPTFASHSECLSFYLANDVSTTGLVARATMCIPLAHPHTPSHGARCVGGDGPSESQHLSISGSANLKAGSAIDC